MKTFFWMDRSPTSFARIIAQGIDYAFFYLVCSLGSLFLPVCIDDVWYLIFGMMVPILWVPIEAFFISRYKTTLGRMFLGIRVETHTADKLPYLVALKRSCFFGIRPGFLRQKALKIRNYFFAICAFFSLLCLSFFERELVVLATGFSHYRTIDGWVDYTANDGSFRVLFPKQPEDLVTKEIGSSATKKGVSYSEYTSHQSSEVQYSVGYIKIPGKWRLAGASRLLQGALDLLIQHLPNTQLITKQLTQHGYFRALDFHLMQGGEEIKGRLILVGSMLYRLTVAYPSTLGHQLQQTEFLNSFEVLG